VRALQPSTLALCLAARPVGVVFFLAFRDIRPLVRVSGAGVQGRGPDGRRPHREIPLTLHNVLLPQALGVACGGDVPSAAPLGLTSLQWVPAPGTELKPLPVVVLHGPCGGPGHVGPHELLPRLPVGLPVLTVNTGSVCQQIAHHGMPPTGCPRSEFARSLPPCPRPPGSRGPSNSLTPHEGPKFSGTPPRPAPAKVVSGISMDGTRSAWLTLIQTPAIRDLPNWLIVVLGGPLSFEPHGWQRAPQRCELTPRGL
jgi:hypothetical protein